ncbi:MAG: DUF2079 domain-containing protein [Anaerolineae bacterium]
MSQSVRKWAAFGLLLTLIALYIAVFSLMSIRRHETLYSNAFDLGNMDQALWNTLQGRILRFTNWPGGTTRLAAHVEPILVPLSLLYILKSDPRTLLVFQTVVMGLGALPAYFLARLKLKDDWAALLFPLAYLLSPALEAANLSDFHAVSLTPSLLLSALYFLERGNYRLLSLFCLLAMACKEEISLLVAMMGLYLWARHRKWRLGLALIAAGSLWFLLSLLVIIPHFSLAGRYPYLSRYAHLGTSPKAILDNLLANPASLPSLLLAPQKVAYIKGLLLSIGLAPLLAPEVALLSLPSLAINLLSTSPWMFSGGAHYSAPLLPFFLAAGIYGVMRLGEWLSPRLGHKRGLGAPLLVALVIVILYHRQEGFSPLAEGVEIPRLTPHHRLLPAFTRLIPPEASLSAQTALNPHTSEREDLYLFPEGQEADYIFLDVTTSTYPLTIPEYRGEVQELLDSGRYRLLGARDGYLLLKRGGGSPIRLPEGFYSFVKAQEIDHPLSIRFEEKLELLGYEAKGVDYLVGKRGSYEFTLYWRALEPLEEDYEIGLLFAREDGALVHSVVHHPATAWYPTHLWKEGEVIALRTPDIWLGERELVHLNLAVVKPGGSEWKISDRLGITSIQEMELYEEETLLYLTTLYP